MPKQVSQRDVSQAVSMISKITTAMFQNIDKYKKAVEKGDEKSVEKYKKIAIQLQDSKVNWEKHMEELLLDLDKNVELAMDESLTEARLSSSQIKALDNMNAWLKPGQEEEYLEILNQGRAPAMVKFLNKYANMSKLKKYNIKSSDIKTMAGVLMNEGKLNEVNAKDTLANAQAALTKTFGGKKLDKLFVKDYLKSIEQMARKNPGTFVKDYGKFDVSDWIEDARYNLQNEGKLNESREFVIIDPRGNARPVGSKMQASQYTKKMGGPNKGWFIVLKKNALKARRAIEKSGMRYKDSKLQDTMFDLMYENIKMKRSELQQIIKEEYQKLITEKFGAKKLADIKKKLGRWDGKRFFASLAKKEGIQWENVTDAAIGNTADLNKNVLNFMFIRGSLKGVFRGKKFVDEFAKPLENFSKGSLGSQYSLTDYRIYYTSYKRVLADADEIVTINLDIAKTESTTVIADRAAQKEGALALKKASDVARENKNRYQNLLRQKRDIAGFGQDEVEKLVGEASKVLEDAVAAHVSQLKSGMVPQASWNNQYVTASRMLGRVMDYFQSYLRAGAEEAKGHEKVLSLDKDASDEKRKEVSWYVDWAVKDAKKYVSDMRTELKDYYLELKKIERAPMRAIGE